MRARSEQFDLLPPLQALIPPRNADNFQRNLALRALAARGVTGLTAFDADWEILKLAGHGGIGHLDLTTKYQIPQRQYKFFGQHTDLFVGKASEQV